MKRVIGMVEEENTGYIPHPYIFDLFIDQI